MFRHASLDLSCCLDPGLSVTVKEIDMPYTDQNMSGQAPLYILTWYCLSLLRPAQDIVLTRFALTFALQRHPDNLDDFYVPPQAYPRCLALVLCVCRRRTFIFCLKITLYLSLATG